MLTIAIHLLIAWFMNLFGFGSVVITGTSEIFGLELSLTGYYFLFALLGLIRSLIANIRGDNDIREALKEINLK